MNTDIEKVVSFLFHFTNIPMNWTAILTDIGAYLTGTTIAAAIVCAVAKAWMEKRIEFSVSHEYEKKLADYENALARAEAREQEQREIRYRGALIAELLSTWLAGNSAAGGIADNEKLNKLSFEAFLWLPENIAARLSDTLSHEPNALSVRDLIVLVRKHLLGDQDSLPAQDVIIFTNRQNATTAANAAAAAATQTASP